MGFSAENAATRNLFLLAKRNQPGSARRLPRLDYGTVAKQSRGDAKEMIYISREYARAIEM